MVLTEREELELLELEEEEAMRNPGLEQPAEMPTQESIPQMLGRNLMGAGQETARKTGQIVKGAYYGVPKGVRQAALMPALPIADLVRTLKGEKNIQPFSSLGQMEQGVSGLVNRIPEAQGVEEQLLQAVGGFAPFSQMVKPIQAGVKALPYAGKLPAVIKSALTGAGYGGSRAVLEGQPQQAIPEAVESAKQFALWHTGGKLGATLGRPFGQGQLGKSIGSALGSGTVGYATAPEGERASGAIFGAGLGIMSPAEAYKTQKMAESVINFRLKPGKVLKDYGKSPARAIVKEGLWGRNIEDLSNKIDGKLNEHKQYINEIKTDVRNKGVTFNAEKGKLLQPVWDLYIELNKTPNVFASEMGALKTFITDIHTRYPNKANLTLDQMYELRDIVNRYKPLGKAQSRFQSDLTSAIHKVYHNIVDTISNTEGVSPELRSINKRMADLIAAREAVQNAIDSNPNYFRFIALPALTGGLAGGFGGSSPLGAAVGLGTMLAETTPGATGMARLLGERYPKLPGLPKSQGGQPPSGGFPMPQPPQPPQSSPINPMFPTTGKGQTVNPMPTIPESIRKIVRKPKASQPTEGKVDTRMVEIKKIADTIEAKFRQYLPEGTPEEIILKNTNAMLKGLGGDNKALASYLHKDNKAYNKIFTELTGYKIGKDVTRQQLADSQGSLLENIIAPKLSTPTEGKVEKYSVEEKKLIENRLNKAGTKKYSFEQYQKVLGDTQIDYLLKFEKAELSPAEGKGFSDKVVNLISQFKSLTPMGQALEGRGILEKIDIEISKAYKGQEQRIPEIKEFIGKQLWGSDS